MLYAKGHFFKSYLNKEWPEYVKMYQLFVIVIFISCLSAFPGQNDEVLILPGLRIQPNFKHYSGYLNGSITRQLHYWFVESQNSPELDPLVLWLNGGPGCSSVDGLITENGPFLVTPEAYLVPNPFSWNKVANIIYLESPSCVGFSYSIDGLCDASDDSTSLLNYNALLEFFIKFPIYKGRDFFITGESYGGMYIPTLSVRILTTKTAFPANFKGIAVGNGYSSSSINDNGNFHFAYNHGLISDSVWSSILASCCKGQAVNHCDITGSHLADCQKKVEIAKNGFGNLNPYNIYSSCATTSNRFDNEIWKKLNVLSNYEKIQIMFGWNSNPKHKILDLRDQYKLLKGFYSLIQSPNSDIPCSNDSAATKYLNRPRVRLALHIPTHVPLWSPCSMNVFNSFKRIYENMTSQYNTLFQQKDFRIWIYNGDVDMMCSYLADEWFFENFNRTVVSPRKEWFYKDTDKTSQVGGFVKIWDKFVLLTVRGSGHMVPTDKPLPAYHLFESFIKGNPL